MTTQDTQGEKDQRTVVEEFLNPSQGYSAVGYQLLLRLRSEQLPGMLGTITTALGTAGANIMDIDIREARSSYMIRDFRVLCESEDHAKTVSETIATLELSLIHI